MSVPAAKHTAPTKGPWTVGDISTPPHERGVFGPDLMAVAKVYMPINYDKQQADANARLIAASPDLLEALEAFMNACVVPKQDMQAERNAIKHAYETGRAALRCALGEDSK